MINEEIKHKKGKRETESKKREESRKRDVEWKKFWIKEESLKFK